MEEKKRGEKEKERERGGGKETGGGQVPPFKRECEEYAQEAFLVNAGEELSCQDTKGRPVHMPEY